MAATIHHFFAEYREAEEVVAFMVHVDHVVHAFLHFAHAFGF